MENIQDKSWNYQQESDNFSCDTLGGSIFLYFDSKGRIAFPRTAIINCCKLTNNCLSTKDI